MSQVCFESEPSWEQTNTENSGWEFGKELFCYKQYMTYSY